MQVYFQKQKKISYKRDKPSKLAHIWEEISSGNNLKAFWRSYEMPLVQPWPIKTTRWEIDYSSNTSKLESSSLNQIMMED